MATAGNLGRISNLLFDRAANLWYRALAIQVLAVAASAVVAGLSLTGTADSVAALGLLMVVAAAYATRLVAEEKQETAETMRRQAALSEGLDWPIEPTQLSEWRRKAGTKILRRADADPRANDYYGTAASPGPRRLAEMTLESEFYTRHLILGIRTVLIIGIVIVAALALLVMYVTLSIPQAAAIGGIVGKIVASAILISIAVDVLGWIWRLGRRAGALLEIEASLDRALAKVALTPEEVLRIVAQYDCEVTASMPIHPHYFAWKHDEIRDLWERRDEASG